MTYSWSWRYVEPERREPGDYSTFGHHLRARVFRVSEGWYVEVLNKGVCINRDGPCHSLTEAFRDAEARVHSARGAWMHSLTGKRVAS